MEQSVLARHDLDEAAIRHDRTDRTLVDLANLWDGDDGLDLLDGSVDALLVGSADLHFA